MSGIRLRGSGHAVPRHIITNDDLALRMDTSDEWITTRTGIKNRHHCVEETQTALCIDAAKGALTRAGISPDRIGGCIVATMTPDTLIPSTACVLQRALGLPGDIPCFDLNAACTGFVFALHTMECLLRSSDRKFGLVVGGEAMSRVVNWDDRSTCILFGDGAGAAVVEFGEDLPSISACLGCQGNDTLLYTPGPGAEEKSLLSMEGTRVFKFAVETVPRCIGEVLDRRGLTVNDVDHFVLHQANARIIDAVIKKMGIPQGKCPKNIHEYGNTSAGSIPILLSELEDRGRLHPGDRILLAGFGGGLTWGGALIEYGKE